MLKRMSILRMVKEEGEEKGIIVSLLS